MQISCIFTPEISLTVCAGLANIYAGALDFALEKGFAVGGWAPKGRICESGAIPERFGFLREMREPVGADAEEVEVYRCVRTLPSPSPSPTSSLPPTPKKKIAKV